MTADDASILMLALIVMAAGLIVALLRALRIADRADRRTALAVREADAAHNMLRHWTERAKRAERSVWGVNPQPGPPPHVLWDDTTETKSTDDTVQMAAVRDGT